jgi:hypothetical protein
LKVSSSRVLILFPSKEKRRKTPSKDPPLSDRGGFRTLLIRLVQNKFSSRKATPLSRTIFGAV